MAVVASWQPPEQDPLGEIGSRVLRFVCESSDKNAEHLLTEASRIFHEAPDVLRGVVQSSCCTSEPGWTEKVECKLVESCFMAVFAEILSGLKSGSLTLTGASQQLLNRMQERGPWWSIGLLLITRKEGAYVLRVENDKVLYTERDCRYGGVLRRELVSPVRPHR